MDAAPTDAQFTALLSALLRDSAFMRKLFLVAMVKLGDRDAADDICQQAFFRAWESRHTIREPASVGGWLVQTAIRLALERRRRRDVERRALQRQATIAREATPGGSDARQEQAELSDKLSAALLRLPELTRSVVVLREQHGMNARQIAEALGISQSTARREALYGLQRLSTWLKSWNPAQ